MSETVPGRWRDLLHKRGRCDEASAAFEAAAALAGNTCERDLLTRRAAAAVEAAKVAASS
jgi:predicted RNA polymerase sigma factor